MSGVDVLAVMHSALGDLMAAQVVGFETETSVPDLSFAIDAVAKLIEAAENMVRVRRGDGGTKPNADAALLSALSRVRGETP